MTANRDPNLLLRAYLDEGMTELPDRVIDAIVADIHVVPQRARWGSWRFLSMSRFTLGAAAVLVAITVAGFAWLGLLKPAATTGGPTPAALSSDVPATQLAADPSSAPSIAPTGVADLGIGSPFPTSDDTIDGGVVYHSVGFSAPLAFTMPKYSSNQGTVLDPGGLYNARTWGDGHTLQVYWGAGAYAVTIHDDIQLSANICKPDAALTEIPPTPDAVGTWLHGIAGITVTDRPDLATTAAGPAKVWDVVFGPSCFEGAQASGGPAVRFGSNEGHRLYAVPTGDDTILVITFSSGVANKMNSETDLLVKSLRFR